MRWVWDAGFAGGSLVATFIQGMTVGALVEGLPIENGQYAGGDFGWLSPFALMRGRPHAAIRAAGRRLAGQERDGAVRDAAYRLIPALALGLLAFLIAVFTYALGDICRSWGAGSNAPTCLFSPAIGALAAIRLALSIQRRDDRRPFTMVALIFAAAFGTLAISLAHIIPFSITTPTPPRPMPAWPSCSGAAVFPLMLVYAAISYRVFEGHRSLRHQATTEELPMRIGLFIPRFIDFPHPTYGVATLEFLERFGRTMLVHRHGHSLEEERIVIALCKEIRRWTQSRLSIEADDSRASCDNDCVG